VLGVPLDQGFDKSSFTDLATRLDRISGGSRFSNSYSWWSDHSHNDWRRLFRKAIDQRHMQPLFPNLRTPSAISLGAAVEVLTS
jgi:hypothetical protein